MIQLEGTAVKVVYYDMSITSETSESYFVDVFTNLVDRKLVELVSQLLAIIPLWVSVFVVPFRSTSPLFVSHSGYRPRQIVTSGFETFWWNLTLRYVV